jgi:hypothetical protein
MVRARCDPLRRSESGQNPSARADRGQFRAHMISIAHPFEAAAGPSPAFVVGGSARGGDHRRLPRQGQVCPPGIPAARTTGWRRLNHRQIWLDERPTGLGLGVHPEFSGVTGLEILLLGRIGGDVDPGRHAGRGEAHDAQRQGTGRA